MPLKYASRAASQLVLQSVLDDIEIKKNSERLLQIIAISRKDDAGDHYLKNYFYTPAALNSFRQFSIN
jgi:hypothetical protein